jgi:putative peptidoglycan lipid II flippase
MIGTAVYQLSVLVDTIFASFGHWVGEGGIAALYFAHRFLHLPLALFGISVAQVALPTMARQASIEDLNAVRQTCVISLRSSLMIAIPASIGLIVLGHPIVATLLEHGAFSSSATAMTVAALQWYAVGLTSMCAVKVLANTLYALQDTWSPVRSAAMALAINVGLNILLIWPMRLAGLALATALSSLWNHLQLTWAVRRRIGPFPEELKGWVIRVCAASVGMGLATGAIWIAGRRLIGSVSPGLACAWLLITIMGGIGTFFLLAFLLRVEEVRGMARWVFRIRNPFMK